MSARDTGTEKLIKDTSKRMFFTEGKIHATTQDIADVAGISRTSLHYYYQSREALMKQVFNEAMGDLNERQYAIMASNLPFREKIEKMVGLFLTETISYPYREVFLITEMLAKDKQVFNLAKKGNPYLQSFLKEVKKEIRDGHITPMNPVQFLMNMIALSAHPLIVSPLHKALFGLSDKQFSGLIKDRQKLIVSMLFQ